MKTSSQVIDKAAELASTIDEAAAKEITQAQALGTRFASRIVEGSRALVLLGESNAIIEAHTIFRLLLEHLFNLGALLHNEQHLDRLRNHSEGEIGRQLKKIFETPKQKGALTDEHVQQLDAFLKAQDRTNDPKDGLNWEQFSATGKTDSFYVTYKLYSFLYAHSTLAQFAKQFTGEDTQHLYEEVWEVLEMARLLLREGSIDAKQSPSC